MKFVRTRLLPLLVVALAVVGLAGCQTNVGAALVVGSHRITENDLHDYVNVDAAAYTTSNGGTVVPRTLALQYLVYEDIFQALAERKGGPITAAERTAALSDALGGSTESAVTQNLITQGFKAKFEPVLVNATVAVAVVQSRYGISTLTQIVAALKTLNTKVSVNPRYGAWDPATLTVTDGPQLGNFLKTTATSAPASG